MDEMPYKPDSGESHQAALFHRRMALFQRRLESLPADEQRAFANRKHPCQDKSFTGMVVARCCAQTLWAEIRHNPAVKRASVAWNRDGFALEVVLRNEAGETPLWESQPYYRGLLVHVRAEASEAASLSPAS